ALPEYCSLEPEVGNCRASITRFYFDGAKCTTFQYGGCGPGENNFETKEMCETSCMPETASIAMAKRLEEQPETMTEQYEEQEDFDQDPQFLFALEAGLMIDFGLQIRSSLILFGKIQSIRIYDDNPTVLQAVVAFVDVKSACRAIETGIILQNVDLKLEYSDYFGKPNKASPHEMNEVSDGKSMYRAISISQLPQRSSDQNIREGLFHEYKKFGKITSVVIEGLGESRCALVTFKKPEDAEKAYDSSQGKIFFGSKIKVVKTTGAETEDPDLCPPEHALDEYHPKATKTLFVGNLNSNTIAKEELRKIFNKYGEIIEIDIKNQANQMGTSYAFVQYTDIKSVVEALKEQESVRVSDKPVKLGFGKSQPTSVVWLDNLAPEITETHLSRHFSKYGRLNYVLVDERSFRSLLFFDSVDFAQRCVNDIRGRNFMNRRVQVDFASQYCQVYFLKNLLEADISVSAKSAAYAHLVKLRESLENDTPVVEEKRTRNFDSSYPDLGRGYTGRALAASSPSRHRNLPRDMSPISSAEESILSEASLEYRSRRSRHSKQDRYPEPLAPRQRKHDSNLRKYVEEELDYAHATRNKASLSQRKDYDSMYRNRRGISPAMAGTYHQSNRRVLTNGDDSRSRGSKYRECSDLEDYPMEHSRSHRPRSSVYSRDSLSPRSGVNYESRLARSQSRRCEAYDETAEYARHSGRRQESRNPSSYDSYEAYPSPTVRGLAHVDSSRSPSPLSERKARAHRPQGLAREKDYLRVSRERRNYVHESSPGSNLRYAALRRSQSRETYDRNKPAQLRDLELSPAEAKSSDNSRSAGRATPIRQQDLDKLKREREQLLRELEKFNAADQSRFVFQSFTHANELFSLIFL
ncbi:hypothetical protein Ciccas_004737, partial [Cichlidogyrus casuarinus]